MKKPACKVLALLIFLACVGARAQEPVKIPPFLHTGDTIAIVAPSYAIKDTSTIDRACSVLREWGFVPVLGENAVQKHPEYMKMKCDHYAGSPEERAAELLWAMEDESVKAIICTRGGYGTIQLVELMPPVMYGMHPKWLVGYSDITTILAGEVMGGVTGIHGQMCGAIGDKKGPEEGCEELRSLLLGNIPEYSIPASDYNRFGHGEGMLVGGNMITFETLMDTSYDITSLDGTILFIEEVEESMHAIDRLFNLLILRGRMPHFSGIVFGQFTKCGDDLPEESVEEMLYKYTSVLGIPVCCGFPAGHGKPNMPLIMGAHAILDVTPEGSTLKFDIR